MLPSHRSARLPSVRHRVVSGFRRADAARVARGSVRAGVASEVSEEPKFSLQQSVYLAAAAFEAYLEPKPGAGDVDVAVNGTTTQYVSKAFLKQAFSATLKVDVRSGRNLNPSDITGKADPYVTVSLGESSGTTAWKFQTLEPEWHESFRLWVPRALQPGAARLRVQVRDKDFVTSDDDMGVAFVGLGELESAGELDLELELQGPRAGNGVVSIKVKLESFDREDETGQSNLLAALTSNLVAFVRGAPGAAKKAQELSDKASLEEQGLTSQDRNAPVMQRAWAALGKLYATEVASESERVAYIESPDTDTQAWIRWNPAAKVVVVAFRGTEQVKWKDLATDLNAVPADLNTENVTDETSLLDRVFKRSDGMRVHSGFLTAWRSVRARVLAVVDACTEGDAAWEVQFTGHSLGGAVATLAAFTFASRTKVQYKLSLYNYGSPRVGNRAFADAYANLVPDTWRIHNASDIVAVIPRLMGYAHVPNGVQIQKGGKICMLDRSGVDVWGEGRSMQEIVEELGEKVKDEARKDEVVEAILKHELELLESLKDGQALLQHMEDVYLEALCLIIADAAPDDESKEAIMEVLAAIKEVQASTAADA